MADLKDGTESKQKAEYVSHDPNVKRGSSPYIEITYKRLDGDNPGETLKTGAFISALDEASKTRIKAGGTFVIVKTKSGNYWNLTRVDDISTYVEKPVSTYTKSYSKGSTGSSGSTYNTAGIKVGAVLHDAVALYGIDMDATYESRIAGVRDLAEKLLQLSFELEANVNAGKYAGTAPTTTTKTVTKTAAPVVETTTLENIDF